MQAYTNFKNQEIIHNNEKNIFRFFKKKSKNKQKNQKNMNDFPTKIF